MKTRTNIHAGSNSIDRQWEKCMKEQAGLNQKISSLENLLYNANSAISSAVSQYPNVNANYNNFQDMSGYCL